MIISQSVEYTKTPSKMGIMKQQVSGSQPSICSEPGKSKDLYDLSEVCPWEMEELPTPTEGKSQKHVSIAPTETNTIHESSAKSGHKSQHKQKGLGQSPSNRRRSRDKTGDRDEGRKPKSPLNLNAHKDASPWNFEDLPVQQMEPVGLSPKRTSHKKNISKSSTRDSAISKRADVCPWETEVLPNVTSNDKQPATTENHTTPTPSTYLNMADVCPWNFDEKLP
uniref:Uncharacterized protein n=1 Tax=Cyprinus carpio TaxID=7962 RepID=A0A8C2FGZ7_CYPCA